MTYSVLITGGSRGIGKATSEIFIKNGYDVKTPPRSELDLLSRESINRYIQSQPEGFDIIINNAGLNEIHNIGELNISELDDMISVNLVAPYLITNGFIKKMVERGFGRIVNIASIWSIVSKPGRSVYSATKRGIHGLSTTLALEYGQYGILSNTVSPGFTLTDLTIKNNSPEEIEKISSTIPIKRMANTEEIAKAIYFVGSAENTYITGQNIVVDGGFSLQ